MSSVLERIRLADVRVNPNNPRQDFGDLEAFAAGFQLNPMHPGEPFNPIWVVRDGNVFRLTDGERRFRAMQVNKIDECDAIVWDSFEESDAAVAMVITDDKMHLKDVEVSRGVQQMLALGVPEEKIDRAAGLESGSAKKARAARDAAGDAVFQMSLAQSFAIADAKAVGDDEAASAIAECDPEELRWGKPAWEDIAHDYERHRKNMAIYDFVKDICKEGGIELVKTRPKGYRVHKTIYLRSSWGRDQIQEKIEKNSPPFCVAMKKPTMNGYLDDCEICVPDERSEEELEAEAKAKRILAEDKACARRRACWMAEHMKTDPPLKDLDTCLDFFGLKKRNSESVTNFVKLVKDDDIDAGSIAHKVDPWDIAHLWPEVDDDSKNLSKYLINGDEGAYWSDFYLREDITGFIWFMQALEADGYACEDHETALIAKCNTWLKQNPEAKTDDPEGDGE